MSELLQNLSKVNPKLEPQDSDVLCGRIYLDPANLDRKVFHSDDVVVEDRQVLLINGLELCE